jgi:hypothetical protein
MEKFGANEISWIKLFYLFFIPAYPNLFGIKGFVVVVVVVFICIYILKKLEITTLYSGTYF